MWNDLSTYLARPTLYAPGSENLWDDAHISKGMLQAHLSPDTDAASRPFAFIDRSVEWIHTIAPASTYRNLLDLGCGPGLYAERFAKLHYRVTGVDFSKRSIAYAKEQTENNGSGITYCRQDYRTLDYQNQFDLVTLIYCDYAAMPKSSRLLVLGRIFQALRPGGKLVFDVFTPKMRSMEKQSWYYEEHADFWSALPHLCLLSVYQYEDDDETELRRTVVCTEDQIRCFDVWDHFFTKEKLLSEVQPVGFSGCECFGDVAGKEYRNDGMSDTICMVLTK